MKSVELLKRLSNNPFYQMSEEERKILSESTREAEPRTSSVREDAKKKNVTKGRAAVKETGRINKHPSDPVEA